MYKCIVCSFETEQSELLEKHIDYNHTNKKTKEVDIACVLCVFMTTSKKEMESHVTHFHEEKSEEQNRLDIQTVEGQYSEEITIITCEPA